MDGWVTIGTKLDTKSFDKQIESVERKINDLENELKDAEKIGYSDADIEALNLELEKAKNKFISLNKQKEKMNNVGLPKIEESTKKIDNSTGNIIKKIGKWALAVFSLRSAYTLISRTSSTLAQYNKEYGANLEYIRFVLAQAIAPVLQFIVNLAFKLLSFINGIFKSLFGINLFTKAGVKDFQKMAGSAKSINQSLQTAGFDEMNILSDTSSTSGGGGVISPTIDITQMEQITFNDITGFLDKIKEAFGNTFDTIINNISKVLSDLGFSEKFIETFELTAQGIKRIMEGLIDTIKGILEIIWGLLTGDAELVKKGFKDLLLGISEMLSGAIQIIIGLIKMVWLALVDIFTPVGEWIWNKVILPVAKFFKDLWNGIVDGVTKAVDKVKTIFNTVKTFFQNIIKNIISLFVSLGTKVGDGISKAFKFVVNAVLAGVERILNSPINAINTLIETINTLPGVQLGIIPTFTLPRLPLKVGGIVNLPSRGVPIGGAYAGEAGAEGVIPLTDSQAMETLGEAIGRYITVNANISNFMNGRLIARQLEQIKGTQDFAYNK